MLGVLIVAVVTLVTIGAKPLWDWVQSRVTYRRFERGLTDGNVETRTRSAELCASENLVLFARVAIDVLSRDCPFDRHCETSEAVFGALTAQQERGGEIVDELRRRLCGTTEAECFWAILLTGFVGLDIAVECGDALVRCALHRVGPPRREALRLLSAQIGLSSSQEEPLTASAIANAFGVDLAELTEAMQAADGDDAESLDLLREVRLLMNM